MIILNIAGSTQLKNKQYLNFLKIGLPLQNIIRNKNFKISEQTTAVNTYPAK